MLQRAGHRLEKAVDTAADVVKVYALRRSAVEQGLVILRPQRIFRTGGRPDVPLGWTKQLEDCVEGIETPADDLSGLDRLDRLGLLILVLDLIDVVNQAAGLAGGGPEEAFLGASLPVNRRGLIVGPESALPKGLGARRRRGEERNSI